MCGRTYSTYSDTELYSAYFNRNGWGWSVDEKLPEIGPNYNACPTQNFPILFVSAATLSIKPMRWGLVPTWAASVKAAEKYSLINARAEDIFEKKSNSIIDIVGEGASLLEQYYYLIHLTDWISFYLAKENGVDADTIEPILYLKAELDKIK